MVLISISMCNNFTSARPLTISDAHDYLNSDDIYSRQVQRCNIHRPTFSLLHLTPSSVAVRDWSAFFRDEGQHQSVVCRASVGTLPPCSQRNSQSRTHSPHHSDSVRSKSKISLAAIVVLSFSDQQTVSGPREDEVSVYI